MGFWIIERADKKDQAAKKPAIALELPSDIWSRDSWPRGEEQLAQAARIFDEDQVPKEDSFGLFLSKNTGCNSNVIIEIDGMVYAVSCVCSSIKCQNHNRDAESFILTASKDHMKYVRYVGCWANEPYSPAVEYKQRYSLSELYEIALKNSRERIARNKARRKSSPAPGKLVPF